MERPEVTEVKQGKKEHGRRGKIAGHFFDFSTVLKYGFSLILACFACMASGDYKYLLFGIIELAAIAFAVNIIASKNNIVADIVSFVLLIVYNFQYGSLLFAGNFLTLVMITNVDSADALKGSGGLYITGIVLIIVFAALPVKYFKIPKIGLSGPVAIALAAEVTMLMLFGSDASSVYNLISLAKDSSSQNQMAAAAGSSDAENITRAFYKSAIDDARTKPDVLPENPNVILIFTEGFSQDVIDDEREICPNISEFQKQSLSFTNYFNHTFATYRGIIGQLYSGYQLKNYDENTLVSIQSVLKDEGYKTSFINPEPTNAKFTAYLESFGFDELVTDPVAGELSDKNAYEKLFEVCEEAENGDKPFFTAIYTFATHVSYDSPDEKYGDGESKILNKFYNMDYQFGKFLEKFSESDMADDTIIVFTSDHCTYMEEEYNKTFDGANRTFSACAEVPLCIYYKGIEPEEIDVDGRNSLALAPTVLDYIDISAPNYFLGTSLFVAGDETNSSYDCLYYDGGTFKSSEGGQIEDLSDTQLEIAEKHLSEYFTAKTQEPVEG